MGSSRSISSPALISLSGMGVSRGRRRSASMRKWVTVTAVLATWVAGPGYAAGPDPVFDVKALSSTPLNGRTLKRTEKGNIVTEEVRFHSETDGGKDVDIFGIFSYPKGGK